MKVVVSTAVVVALEVVVTVIVLVIMEVVYSAVALVLTEIVVCIICYSDNGSRYFSCFLSVNERCCFF